MGSTVAVTGAGGALDLSVRVFSSFVGLRAFPTFCLPAIEFLMLSASHSTCRSFDLLA